MLTTLKSLILTVAITACGKPSKEYVRQDPMAGDAHLIAEYYDAMSQYLDGGVGLADDLKVVKIEYNVLDGNTLGRCTYDPDGRFIQIRNDLRDIPAERAIVLFHEVGHCAYNLKHYEDKPDIMNAVLNYLPDFEANPQAYKEQMFTRMRGGEGVLNFVDLESIQ